MQVIGSVTESSAAAALDCVRGYNELDLAAILVLPPFYFRDAPPEGISDFLARIASASDHRVLGDHIPNITPAVPLKYLSSSTGRTSVTRFLPSAGPAAISRRTCGTR